MLKYGMIGAMGAFEYGEFKRRVREGQNPAYAAAAQTAWWIPWFYGARYGIATQAAVALPSLIRAGSQYVNYTNRYYNRVASMPFSHRFEHTDATMAVQTRALQSLGAAVGALGREAYGVHARRNRI